MAVHMLHEAIMACLSFSKISVEPFMFLNMNVFFLTFVTVPQIILDNICLLKHNETKCLAMFSGSFKEEFDIVQEQATLWFGGLLVMVTFIIILTLPFIGALSDFLGRYTAMFLSPVCQILQSLITLGIVLNGLPFPTWVLLLVASIPALVGDLSGFFVLTESYITAITSEKTRTLRMTLLEGAGMMAGLSATLSSGFIIEKFGYAGIFVTNILLLVLALLYLTFCVKPANKMQKEPPMEPDVEGEEMSSLLDNVTGMASKKTNEEEDRKIVEEEKDVREIEEVISKDEEDFRENKEDFCENEEDFRESEDVLESEANARENGDIRKNEVVSENGEDVCENEVSSTEGAKDNPCSSDFITKNDVNENKEVNTEMPVPNAFDCNSSVPVIQDVHRCDTEEIRKIDDRAEGKHGTITPHLEKLGPGIENSPEVTCTKTSSCSKLRHILKESNPIHNLMRVYRILKEEGQLFNGPMLFFLILLNALAYSGEASVLTLYLKNRPYFLSARLLGLYLAYGSGTLAIVGMVILNFLFTRVIKMNDHILLLISLCALLVYYVLLALAQSMLMLYLIQLIHALGTLSTCIIRASLTKIVPAPTVGLLLGALIMFETAGVLLGSIICPIVYSQVAATYPGAVFFINVAFTLLSVVATSVFLVKNRNNGQSKRRNELTDLVDDGTEA